MKESRTQLQAIQHTTGPAMVLAGPGSGKTTVITHRVRHLIAQQGVPAERILVITFTKAAALQMQERFLKMDVPGGERVRFGTFHAVFFTILRSAYHYTAGDILRDEERRSILTELAAEAGADIEESKDQLRLISGEISAVKNGRIPLDCFYSSACPEETFRRIFRGYQKRLRAMKKLDYDDMLVYTLDLLCARPDILARWQEQFAWLLIDEFQDINPLQYDIVKLLAAPENNLFVVGDDDQSIYAFRGSAPALMLDFPKLWPDAKQYMLQENYRSGSEIVAAAGRVIAENRKRFPKKILSAAPAAAEKKPVALHCFEDAGQESVYLAGEIRRNSAQGIAYGQMAVLTRTALDGRFIANRLSAFGVPVQVRGAFPSLYDHWVVKDIMAYLRLGLGGRDRRDFLQVMNRPVRYISRECLDTPQISFDRLRMFYEDRRWMIERLDQLEEALDRIGRMKPYAAVNYIRFGLDYDKYLEEYAQQHRMDPLELTETAGELQEEAKAFGSFREWSDYIEDKQKQKAEEPPQGKNTDAVRILTLHSAKGLEFDCVFLPDLNEGILPSHKASVVSDIEEERRLLYVGMTRARKKLYLLWTKKRFGKDMLPSRFLTALAGAAAK